MRATIDGPATGKHGDMGGCDAAVRHRPPPCGSRSYHTDDTSIAGAPRAARTASLDTAASLDCRTARHCIAPLGVSSHDAAPQGTAPHVPALPPAVAATTS